MGGLALASAWGQGCVGLHPRNTCNTCVFACIQSEGWKKCEYAYLHGDPRVFNMYVRREQPRGGDVSPRSVYGSGGQSSKTESLFYQG